MASTVWVSGDIARIAAGGMAIAPSRDFAAGVAWLASQLNAPVRLPERQPAQQVVVIDAPGREVSQPIDKSNAGAGERHDGLPPAWRDRRR